MNMLSELGTRDTVLVVDDCGDELGMVANALEHTKVKALTANSGIAALRLVESIRPQLVVLDAVMPGIDGFETCRRLKSDKRFAHLPVIFMTGLKDPEHVVRGLEVGGVDYVTKPVNIDELLARIRVHIANARIAHGARTALDATGRHLIATDAGGQPRWWTPQAAAFLASALKIAESDRPVLPDSVAAHLRAMIAARALSEPQSIAGGLPDFRVSFLGPSGDDEFLFRLGRGRQADEELLEQEFGVTRREAEVLIWLTRGKTNNEISEILAISPRTVNKHLERIFVKLGVENRSAAASVALRSLSAAT